MSIDSDDSEGYKSPPASNQYVPKIVQKKIPLDDYHTCPCCNGKGYVGIVKDRILEHRTRSTGLTKWRPK